MNASHLNQLSKRLMGIIKPYLENQYGNNVRYVYESWPKCMKNTSSVKNGQTAPKREAKMEMIVPELDFKYCKERLQSQKLSSRAYERSRGNLIMAYKSICGINSVNTGVILPASQFKTTNIDKLKGQTSFFNLRKHFFKLNIAVARNRLATGNRHGALSVNTFKTTLVRYYSDHKFPSESATPWQNGPRERSDKTTQHETAHRDPQGATDVPVGMSSGDALSWFSEPEMKAIQLSPEAAKKWADEVNRRYSEDQRHYHVLQHLSDMMSHLRTWRKHINGCPAVVLAILFHDIVYSPPSSTNEDDSIELFKKFAEEVNLNEEISGKVIELIDATKKHLPTQSPADPDLLYFLDFDMAILGQSQQVYDVYATNIKKEYCHISTEDFCNGRIKVLQNFMARPRIYFTEELLGAFEERARQNMQREIESLRQQLTNPA